MWVNIALAGCVLADRLEARGSKLELAASRAILSNRMRPVGTAVRPYS